MKTFCLRALYTLDIFAHNIVIKRQRALVSMTKLNPRYVRVFKSTPWIICLKNSNVFLPYYHNIVCKNIVCVKALKKSSLVMNVLTLIASLQFKINYLIRIIYHQDFRRCLRINLFFRIDSFASESSFFPHWRETSRYIF